MNISLLKKIRGFTLIELMVVIAIIALLTGIIMTNLVGSKAKARDAKRISDIGQIQLALELYFDRCKQYPASSPLNSTDFNGCPVTTPQINFGTFLQKIPTPPSPMPDPSGYEYASIDSKGDGRLDTYVLRVALEANNPALQDDIDANPTNWPSGLDLGDACKDTVVSGNLPYQYCIVSN